MGPLSQRSHKDGWVVRKKKMFRVRPLKFCLAFLQAPPRTLRPRFRKKSTSSSATETMWVQWANSTKIHRMSLFCLKELLVQNIGNSSGMDVLWCTALQTWPFSLLSPHPSVTRCCRLSLTWVGQSGRHLQVRGPGLVCRVCTHPHCTFTVSFVSA